MQVEDNYIFTKKVKMCLIHISFWESLASVHYTAQSHIWTRDELNYLFN